MAIETQTDTPTVIRAGDTTIWTVEFSDYPASTWALRYFFTREGEKPIEVDGVASSDAFVFTLQSEDSAQFCAGRWQWASRAELQGTGSVVVQTGEVDILPDPSAPHKMTFSEEALEMVERSIRGDLPTAQESYSLVNQDVTKMGLSERFQLRDRIKAEVRRERQRRRLNAGREYNSAIQVRFTS